MFDGIDLQNRLRRRERIGFLRGRFRYRNLLHDAQDLKQAFSRCCDKNLTRSVQRLNCSVCAHKRLNLFDRGFGRTTLQRYQDAEKLEPTPLINFVRCHPRDRSIWQAFLQVEAHQ